MEEKKTIVPRRRMSPSLRKILLLLVLLLIPIFLAGAGFLVYSIINARESGRERIDTAVSTQLEDLDSSLSMVNLYLTETLMNNSLTKKINTEEDTHDRLVAARSLWEEFDRQEISIFFTTAPPGACLSPVLIPAAIIPTTTPSAP